MVAEDALLEDARVAGVIKETACAMGRKRQWDLQLQSARAQKTAGIERDTLT